MASKLAIFGGEPCVTINNPEQWKRPIEEERKLVNQLLEEGLLSGSGTGLPKEFEDEFRKFIGCKYCLTVDHGSTALTSAYWAVGVGPGDEVITPTRGYIGAYSGTLHMAARPVFCDIDPKTLLIDPEDVERKMTKRTRAINPVCLHGQVCDMDTLIDIGRRYGIPIVVDASHVHGAEWDGKKIGNVADITCFSIQGVDPWGKPVSGGEGGIVTTNSRELYERLLIYCHLHRTGILEELANSKYSMFDNEVLGLKWRAHPLALAMAKVSLRSLEYRNERKRRYRDKLYDALNELPGLEPVHVYPKAKNAGFYGGLCVMYHPEDLGGLPIEKFMETIRAEGAPVRSGPNSKFYKQKQGKGKCEHLKFLFTRGFDLWGHDRGPLGGAFLALPPFEGYKKGDLPVAESMMNKELILPAYIEPKEGFLEQCIEAFRKVSANYKLLL